MTGNVRDNCYPHIRLLSTHPHLALSIRRFCHIRRSAYYL